MNRWSMVHFVCFQLNGVKLVGKELEDLQGARDEAVQFLKLENDIALIENKLLQVYRYLDIKGNVQKGTD